jgi:leader peptidase (prepilin peptidase)/N-methyltransferase
VAVGFVGGAGLALDLVWRRLASGLGRGRWSLPPIDPPFVLGAVAGLVAALLVATAPSGWVALVLVPLGPIAAVGGAVDLRLHRLPDRLTLGATALLAALVTAGTIGSGDAGMLVTALTGAALFAGLLLAVHLVSPAGMGFGDVKLGVPLGLALGSAGVATVVAGLLFALCLGALGGVVVLARHRDRRRAFAFGPFLVAGAIVALVL